MPRLSAKCQPALASELHWLHRGQQKDSTAHAAGLIYLTAPSFQQDEHAVWTVEAQDSSVVMPNPIWLQWSIGFSLVGFCSVWGAVSRQQIPNALNLQQICQNVAERACSHREEFRLQILWCLELLSVSAAPLVHKHLRCSNWFYLKY